MAVVSGIRRMDGRHLTCACFTPSGPEANSTSGFTFMLPAYKTMLGHQYDLNDSAGLISEALSGTR